MYPTSIHDGLVRVYSALTWDVWIHLLLNLQLMGLVLVLRVLHSLGSERVKE